LVGEGVFGSKHPSPEIKRIHDTAIGSCISPWY
jgi:hypothetical protein